MYSPVRLFTVPTQPAIGVYAKKDIPIYSFVMCYAGVVTTDDYLDHQSEYAYTLNWENFKYDKLTNTGGLPSKYKFPLFNSAEPQTEQEKKEEKE